MKKDSWSVDQYEKFKRERAQPFHDLMSFVTPAVFDRVIDLGCGSGELTKILHEKLNSRSTIGIDSSANMLVKAKDFSGNGLEFEQGTVEQMQNRGKFDLIFSNAALQWCDNHQLLFKNFRESLNFEGQVAHQMPMNHDYPTHVLANEIAQEAPFRDLLQMKEGAREVSLLKPEEYAALLFRLGFREQQVMLKVYGHVLESREGVIEWVKGTLLTYYQSRLTPEDFERFLARFRERLFQALPDEKPFFYPFKRILIWAKL